MLDILREYTVYFRLVNISFLQNDANYESSIAVCKKATQQ